MQTKPVSIRLPADLVTRLKVYSHTESLRTGRQLTLSSLIREVVEKHLLCDGVKVPPKWRAQE